jgi:hypothetical protein
LLATILAESELKRKTLLLALLALSAGVLSVLVSTTPVVRAEGGYVEGAVYWIDQYGNMRPMEWAQVTADDGSSLHIVAYTTNGSYEMWLPTGTYEITASSDPGFYPKSASSIVVSPGSSTSIDFTLEPTGRPIPELTSWTQPIIVLAALMITAVAVRRHKTRTRN